MSDHRTETFSVTGTVRLELRLGAGRATVLPGDEGAVVIDVRGRDAGSFRIEQSGDHISLRPEDGFGNRWRSYDLTIRLPAGSQLEVRTASADVDIEVGLSRLRANCASGDLRAGNVSGEAVVRSASGNVGLSGVDGRLDVSTASGDIEVERADGEVTFRGASGDLAVGAARGSLSGRSASGDVWVRSFEGELLRCTTASGNVRVGLPAGRTVDVDVSTLSGGLHNDFAAEPGGGSGDGPTSRLQLRTVSGDVRLERAAP